MANQVTLPKNRDLAKEVVQSQNEIAKIKTERGWLGNIWGAPKNIPNNIAALVILLSFILGALYTVCNYNKKADELNLSIKDFWAILTPLITLSIGYLFGHGRDKKDTNE